MGDQSAKYLVIKGSCGISVRTGGANDTRLSPPCLGCETSDVDDDSDVVTAGRLGHGHAMQGRRLHDGPELVAACVDFLSPEHAVHDGLGARVDFHAAHHEALDLVHVEALVDPGDQQALGRIRLGPDFAMLTLLDFFGPDDQGEHTERRLGKRRRPRGGPGVNAHVGLGLEMLPAGFARAHPALPRSPKRAWSTAMIAGPAVSVRKILGPTPTTAHPRVRAASTSSDVNPPSGPMRSPMWEPGARAGGRVAASVVPSKRPCPPPWPPAATSAKPSHRQSRRSAASATSIACARARGSSTSGTTARPH